MLRAVVVVILLVGALGAGIFWFAPDVAQRLGLSELAGLTTRQAPARPQQRRAVPVEVITAAAGRVEDTVEALGTLTANESVPIAPEVSGRITTLHFDEGQRVARGAMLVELDGTIARAELAQATANLSLARDVLERSQTLAQRGVGTQVSLEQATAQLAIARANVATAEARLEKLTIHAPFAGLAGLRSVSVGTIVPAGQAITTLTSVDPIKVDFGVPEIFLGAVRIGQAIDVTVDAVPGRTFTGTVYAIDPVVNVSGRAVRLRATIPNADSVLKPGLFARVTLTTGVREDAVLVPEAALVASATELGSAVFVVRGGRADRVDVTAGARVDGRVEIVEGVAVGDAVVVAGQMSLQDGTPVTVTEAAPVAAPRTEAAARPEPSPGARP